MKKSSKEEVGKAKPKPGKVYTFPNVSNEECIRIAVKLMGISDELFEKETKNSMRNELFPRNTVAASSKTFFFICQLCIKQFFSPEQAQELLIWYPPRTANEQIEFKKVFFKLIQRLETQGQLPKNIILSKASIAGDPTNQAVLQFLRVLTELALRNLYIDKYSKEERLLQISLNDSPEADLNAFYPFPFCQCTTNVESPLKGQELLAVKKIYRAYIDRYRQKILQLQAESEMEIINPQQLMSQLLEQRQIASTLTSKVSQAVFSENRAFDRRVIIDRHRQLWKEINNLSCAYAEPTSSSVLRMQGDIAKALTAWRTVSGTHVLNDFNTRSLQFQSLKKGGEKVLDEFKTLKEKIIKAMS